jgi:hypothetical protein
MSDPAATLALIKWLKDRIKEWEADAKAALPLMAGERAAAKVGGAVLGFVTMTRGRKTARVVNDAALLAYVRTHYPTEVEVTERVNPAFLRGLLDKATMIGAFIDTDGQVLDGLIEVTEGDPYPMAKLNTDADITMAGLLGRGGVGIDGLKEIEP